MNIVRLSLIFSLVVSVSVDAYAAGAGICAAFDDGTLLLGEERRLYRHGPQTGQIYTVWSEFGGGQDPQDQGSLAKTALREFKEETAHYTFPAITLADVQNAPYADHIHHATGQFYRIYFLWIHGPKPTIQSIHQNAALANQNFGLRAHVEKHDWKYFDARVIQNAHQQRGNLPGTNSPLFGPMKAVIRQPAAQQFLANYINAIGNAPIEQPVVQPQLQPVRPKPRLVQHHRQPDSIQVGKTVQSLLTNVYNYHAGNGAKQLADLGTEEKGQILETATSFVLKGIYEKPDTTPLIHAWETVTGKGWAREKSTQSLLSNVYNYHAGNGVKQLVNLSEGQTGQILEKATSLVLKGMYEKPDTTPLIHAWEVVMGKGWGQEKSIQGLLTNVYNYHAGKGIKQFANLNAEEKVQVIETATSLVLKKLYKDPDTTPLIRAWEIVMKEFW